MQLNRQLPHILSTLPRLSGLSYHHVRQSCLFLSSHHPFASPISCVVAHHGLEWCTCNLPGNSAEPHNIILVSRLDFDNDQLADRWVNQLPWCHVLLTLRWPRYSYIYRCTYRTMYIDLLNNYHAILQYYRRFVIHRICLICIIKYHVIMFYFITFFKIIKKTIITKNRILIYFSLFWFILTCEIHDSK